MRFIRSALVLLLILALFTPCVMAENALVERQVFDYLTGTLGLNSAAACGVLANIEAESGFSLGALGDSGSSYGLCQWHNSRCDNLKSYCAQQGLDYRTVDGQMAYLTLELKTWYQSTYATLRNVPDTAEGAYTAAWYWCVYFESPADAENSGIRRGNNAQLKFWPKYAGRALDSKGYSSTSFGPLSSPTFYWENGASTENDRPLPAVPSYAVPTAPTISASAGAEESPTLPLPTEPEPTEPAATEPAPKEHAAPRFHYTTHHSPMAFRPRVKVLTPTALAFLCCPPPKAPFSMPVPQEEREEVL